VHFVHKHFVRLATALLKDEEVHETTMFLVVILPNIHLLKNCTGRLSNKL